MWGTDENWVRVAMHFNIEGENPREALVKHLDSHENDRSYGKKLMEDNGIWEKAFELAKSMHLDIMPKPKYDDWYKKTQLNEHGIPKGAGGKYLKW